MQAIKREYLELADKLHKLAPADPKGMPWVQRREEIRAILKAAGEDIPRYREVRV